MVRKGYFPDAKPGEEFPFLEQMRRGCYQDEEFPVLKLKELLQKQKPLVLPSQPGLRERQELSPIQECHLAVQLVLKEQRICSA
jgi:hypothetical protein